MAEDTTSPIPEASEDTPLLQRLEEDLAEAKAELTAVPAQAAQAADTVTAEGQARAAAISQHLDAFWANVFANVSPHVSTDVHNFLWSETEALKAKLSTLI